jgi:multidrug efflux pump
MMMIYAALCLALYAGLSSLPSSFLPDEDQGYFMSSIQLPSDATMQRTLKVVENLKRKSPIGRRWKVTL